MSVFTSPAFLTLMGSLLTAVAMVIVGNATQRTSRKTSDATNIYSRIDKLENRVDKLEQENTDLRRVNATLVDYVEDLLRWVFAERLYPMPKLPKRLQSYVDETFWVVAHHKTHKADDTVPTHTEDDNIE